MEIEQDYDIHSSESRIANDVYSFLKENRFLHYWSGFDREGYDDMEQLLEMTPDHLEEALAQDIGIKKIGHLKRLKALLAIRSVRNKPEEHEDKDSQRKSNNTQTLPDSISSRLLIPHPIMEKHKYYNELLYELFNASYELFTHDSFMRYVIGQRESRWKLKQRLDNMQSYEVKFAESNDGHWQNIRKYVDNQAKLTSKDMKPAERSVEFMSSILKEIESFMVECKTLKSNLFDKENNVKPWKANELLFLENIIKDLAAIEVKMVKAKGDIFQNVCYFKRRALGNEAILHDDTPSTRRVKENKRKSLKRKENRKLSSCCKVLEEIIGLEADAQEMIAKVDKGDFSFSINNADFIPEKLLALKPMAEEAINNMEAQNIPRTSIKKRKIGQKMSIQGAFKNTRNNPSNIDNSPDSTSDEEESDNY